MSVFHEIGTILTIFGQKYEIIEYNGPCGNDRQCKMCDLGVLTQYIIDENDQVIAHIDGFCVCTFTKRDIRGWCIPTHRKDNKRVIFKSIK